MTAAIAAPFSGAFKVAAASPNAPNASSRGTSTVNCNRNPVPGYATQAHDVADNQSNRAGQDDEQAPQDDHRPTGHNAIVNKVDTCHEQGRGHSGSLEDTVEDRAGGKTDWRPIQPEAPVGGDGYNDRDAKKPGYLSQEFTPSIFQAKDESQKYRDGCKRAIDQHVEADTDPPRSAQQLLKHAPQFVPPLVPATSEFC